MVIAALAGLGALVLTSAAWYARRRNADGSGQTRLTTNAASDKHPDWQPIVGVGGIAELPEVAGAPLEAADSSGPSAGLLAGIAALAGVGALALGGAAWYARRRGRG